MKIYFQIKTKFTRHFSLKHHELIECVSMVFVHATLFASLKIIKKEVLLFFLLLRHYYFVLSYSGLPSSSSQEKNVWCSWADRFMSWKVNGSLPLYCVKRWYSAPRKSAQGFFQTLHSFTPVTGLIESMPLVRQLLPLELLLPLLHPFVNDDDGTESELLADKLFESLPFKIGVKWLIETCSIKDVPYRLKYHHSKIWKYKEKQLFIYVYMSHSFLLELNQILTMKFLLMQHKTSVSVYWKTLSLNKFEQKTNG